MQSCRCLTVVALHVLACLAVAWLVTGKAGAQAGSTTLVWQAPEPIVFPAALSSVQLDATALVAPPQPVSLANVANVVGITSDGVSFSTGGFDAVSWAYSAEQLGPSVSWHGIVFPLLPPDRNNVVSGATVAMPAGNFASLWVLGDLVNNEVPPLATFTLTYTDGSRSQVSQSMSDWVNPRNYPGESLVQCTPTRHNSNGSIDPNSVCLYGYQLSLDPSRTLASISLPRDRDVVVVSMVLVPPAARGEIHYSPAAGTVLTPGTTQLSATFVPADAGSNATSAPVPLEVDATAPLVPEITWPTPAPIALGMAVSDRQLNAQASTPLGLVAVPLRAYSRVNALYADGTVYLEKGFDGSGRAYSASLLGPAVHFAGFTFPLGSPALPDAATSSTVPLPPGRFARLYLIGAGAQGTQHAQPFTVGYSDGTSTVTRLDLSAWDNPQSLADETAVASMPYAVTPSGALAAGSFALYGYTVPLDPTRTVATLTLPPTTNVVVLAAGLDSGTQMPVAGQYVYNVAPGTVLPGGNNPLSVRFTPADSLDFLPATATNTLLVVRPVLTLLANDTTRPYGAPDPAFSGSVAGALAGDSFSENFSTTATLLSPPGSYPIVPSAEGANLQLYTQAIRPGTLLVTRASAVLTLTANAAQALQRQPVTLRVSVASSTSGTPSGTVQFFSGASLLGSVALANGVAAFATALPVGTPAIRAVYSGDGNFLPAEAAATSVQILPLDFVLSAPNGTALSATTGQTPSLTLTVAPMHGVYASALSFSVSGSLPPQALVRFAPAQVGADSGAQQLQMQVEVPRLAAGLAGAQSGVLFVVLLPVLGLWCRRFRRFVPLSLAVCLLMLIGGCGSGYHDHVYSFVVSATDGTVVHTLPVTLHVAASPQ